jgi:hypothetical protein
MQRLLLAFTLVSGMLIGTLMSQRQWLTDTAQASHNEVTTDCVGANLNSDILVVSLTNTSNNNRNANVVIRDIDGTPVHNDNALEVGNFNTEFVILVPAGNQNASWVRVKARSSIKVGAFGDVGLDATDNDNHQLQCYT